MAVQPQTQQQATAAPAVSIRRIFGAIGENYLLNRFLKAILTIWAVATLVFFLIRLMPGNPIEIAIYNLVNTQQLSYAEARIQVQSLFSINLDEPIFLQYRDFLGNILHGSLGTSYTSRGQPVTQIILGFLPWTLFSVGLGLLVSFIIGIGLGILLAYKREGIIDHTLGFIGAVLSGIPAGVLVIMMIVLLQPKTGIGIVDWSKMRGAYSPDVQPGFTLQFIGDVLYHAIIPVVTYVLLNVSTWMLLMKSNTVSALEEDYVNVARAKGLKDTRIATTYVGRNAILPLVTQFTLALAFSLGGSTLIEKYFVYRGIGGQLGTAVGSRDYPVMQGIFLVLTIVVVFGNLLTDLLYGVIDPRIRVRGGSR